MKDKENKKKSKLGVICKTALVTLAVAGAGYLAYKKIPKVKTLVDGLLSPKNSATEIKEAKPFRKYETFRKR